MGQRNLYTVNTTGAYATEDYDFRRETQEIIRACVKAHERGASIKVEKT